MMVPCSQTAADRSTLAKRLAPLHGPTPVRPQRLATYMVISMPKRNADKGTYKGKPFNHRGRFTDTWVRLNGKWLCVATHSSLIKM
jgi:hypothetical protein